MNNSSFIVCAYYTADYKEYADNLKASLEQFNIPNHIQLIEDQGNWQRNTGYKPRFILDTMEQYPDLNVVYLDADCEVKRPPELFDQIQEDVGLFFTPQFHYGWYKFTRLFGAKKRMRFTNKTLTGTLFFKQSQKAKQFLSQWIESQSQHQQDTDQGSLDRIIEQSDCEFFDLPFHYVKIFDHGGQEAPVIEHYQASREFRKDDQRSAKRARRQRRVIIISIAVLVILGALIGWSL